MAHRITMTTTEKFEKNNSSFEKLMNIYKNCLKRHALRLTKNHEQAEDLYQETSIKIFLNLNKLVDEKIFINWAMRIMHNIFLDNKRYNSRRPITTSFEELNEIVGNEVEFEDKSIDIESEYMLKMINEMNSRQIRSMITQLSPTLSETISLSTYGTKDAMDIENSMPDGLDYKSVGKLANIDLGTVRSRLHRAKENLAKMSNI